MTARANLVGTLLRLGRVSNLPTVWTNALAGTVLAGGTAVGPTLGAAVALTLFYIGGMFLNDAFDAKIDRCERANRPIPQGEIRRGTVFAAGFGLLAAGLAVAFLLGPAAGAVAALLATTIVLYDWLHKKTPLAPLIMGATRFLSYALAALAATHAFAGSAVPGALGLFAYVAGLTYAAKQEAFDRLEKGWPLAVLAVPFALAAWGAALAPGALLFVLALGIVMALALRLLRRRAAGDIPRAVTTLIAGISIYDAALMAAAGATAAALAAAAAFGLTLLLQRVVAGT